VRIGIIGTGNMGGMLAKAFAADARLSVSVYNRSTSKAEQLVAQAPVIKLARSVEEIAESSDIIFLCTKSGDGICVMNAIGSRLSPTQSVCSIISTLLIAELETLTSARVAKVIPSIVQSVRSGVMLVSYSPRFDDEAMDTLELVLKRISIPFQVEESQIRLCSDLTSCGPAFISYLLSQWASAASATKQISHAEAEHLLCQTLLGTADLLRSGMTLSDILTRVTVPGGVTEVGLQTLRDKTSPMFRELHACTASHAHSPLL